jgi:Xaa-Pro dipeptidase
MSSPADPGKTAFSSGEYAERLHNVRKAMHQRGVDTLVLTDPSNIYYLSGYEAWSFYVPQYLVVRQSDLIWFGREMDRFGASIVTWLRDDQLLAYPDDYVQNDGKHPAQLLAQQLKDRGWDRGPLGLELGNYYLTVNAFQLIECALPNATLVDCSLLVNWIRLVKSEAELRYMREAARIVEGAMRVAVEGVRAGVRQSSLAGDIYQALVGGTQEFGGQYASSPPFMPSGDRVATPHLSWTDAPYLPSTQTNFELVAARHRYHVPLSRSVFLGAPSKELKSLESAAIDGVAAALEAVRPGARAGDVEAAWQKAARRHGVRKNARCGYSIGIAYPPTFGEQTASLRPGDMTELAPGMTFHLMPGLWQEGSSIVITEPFVVTDSGAELLCRFDRRLFVND